MAELSLSTYEAVISPVQIPGTTKVSMSYMIDLRMSRAVASLPCPSAIFLFEK
ncbi:hypothetical protein KIN20_000439 [Parelaphostrongylus tenuis]|uniref:Uncharacterized protein n=1 Tax=Parelaphostrongylus tenuis TaxID=148309 RepID=A0AAD5QFK4_PARTN|nr:hypothetical protein KIN20_000439 [Parelaphostrongylus tenuis]